MDPRDRVIHFHDLKRMARSPAHYLAGLELDESDKPAFRFGRLVHKILLGGHYVVYDGGDRRGKKWEEFAAAHEGQDIFKTDEVHEALMVADAVRTHPLAAPLLVGDHEVPVQWTMLGRKVQTRGIDVLGPRRIVELKTTSNAEPSTFQRGALRFGYHAQLAMYHDAALSLGRDIEEHFVIAVETVPPFAVTVLRPTMRLIGEGTKLLRSWMERLKSCEEANEWPAYCQSIVDWDVVDDVGLIIDGEEIAA